MPASSKRPTSLINLSSSLSSSYQETRPFHRKHPYRLASLRISPFHASLRLPRPRLYIVKKKKVRSRLDLASVANKSVD